jgi:hypothetical protein
MVCGLVAIVLIRLTSSWSCSVVMSLTIGFSRTESSWYIGASGANGLSIEVHSVQ